MNFDDILKMLFTEWYFPLLLTYMAGCLTYFIYKSFPNYDPKAIKLFAFTIFAGLVLLYFVIPVPGKVQNDYVQFERSFIAENKGFNGVYTALTKRNVCNGRYLTVAGYFKLKSSFRKDMDLAFKEQGYLSGAPYEKNSKVHQYICDFQ